MAAAYDIAILRLVLVGAFWDIKAFTASEKRTALIMFWTQ
jgi:hypothetical protein